MANDAKRLLLLCHDGGWDRLHQAASAAATAASTGWTVDVVFFYEALERLLDGTLDEARAGDASERVLVDRAEERGVRPPSMVFAAARSTGRCRFMACSASLGLLDRDPTEVDPETIDEVVGWPTTVALLERSDHALYL